MIYDESLQSLTQRLSKNALCGWRLFLLLSLPVTLMIFALVGYFKIINFNIELHSVVMIGVIFLIFLFFLPHNSYYASCKLRRNFLDVKLKLLDYINKNLLDIAGCEKANASLDEFLKGVAKGLRNENFASIAAGIFPTLGILGTFISIAISMPDFGVQTSEVLEQEISKLLGGVGTAFYVSIYGIFLSIWWIFFEKSGTSRFQKDAAIIKEETRDYFWQKEEIEQTYFRKSMENFEKLNRVFDTFTSHEFLSTLNDTLAQRMGIFQTIIEHEQSAASEVANILKTSTRQLDELSTHQRALTSALENIIERFEHFSKELHGKDESFLRAHKVLGDDFERAVSVAEVLSQNTVKLNDALSNINADNVQNLYSGVIKNIESLKREIDGIGESLDKRINQFDAQFLHKLQNTLKLIDSETAQIISQLAKLKE